MHRHDTSAVSRLIVSTQPERTYHGTPGHIGIAYSIG
jgi:hypothetical protein